MDDLNALFQESKPELTEEQKARVDEAAEIYAEKLKSANENDSLFESIQKSTKTVDTLAYLHAELAVLRADRTEDNIGLSDPYWTKKNEIQQHLNSLKAE